MVFKQYSEPMGDFNLQLPIYKVKISLSGTPKVSKTLSILIKDFETSKTDLLVKYLRRYLKRKKMKISDIVEECISDGKIDINKFDRKLKEACNSNVSKVLVSEILKDGKRYGI